MDIKKAGLYRYAQSPAFSILLFAYSLDFGPVQVIDLAQGEQLPPECMARLFDTNTIKHAYNAPLEWYCLSRHFRLWDVPNYPPEKWLPQWRCTMLHGLYCGCPAGLDAVGKALGLAEEQQKLSTGKALIRYFCTPCAPTKTNGQRTRDLPHHDLAKWELFKTSNKKYNALETAVCADGRVRGLLQFYGAARTGRWAGRIVQPQNLPRTYIRSELLPLARELVEDRQMDALKVVFGSVPDTLSQLIRTALVAAPGCTLVDADFSSIEARVIVWLAGEEWALEVFRTHGKIYEATAAQLYDVPMERIVKGNPEYALRQYGKAATLALGYQGGPNALITAGHLDKDTPEEKLLDIRDRWRQKNRAIVDFWYKVDAAAKEAVQTGRSIELPDRRLAIARECDPANHMDFLTIRLPSGRKLYYAQPHMGTNRFGQLSLCYLGQNQTSKKWQVLETYGGKLAENITQAIARDCLAEAIDRVEAAGYRVVFHIHDEIVTEVPNGSEADLKRITELMSQVPTWAAGLPLNAEGWVNPFFKKE